MDTIEPQHNYEELRDNVNRPAHYCYGRVEVFDQQLKLYGKEAMINHCEITAFKYRMRAGYKGDIVEDIKKAMWYEKKALELLLSND